MPIVYKFSHINPSCVLGAMFALAKNGISIMPTINRHETVIALCTMAKAEQTETGSYPKVHPMKRTKTVKESQVFLIASLPFMGKIRAVSVLEDCKTPLYALNHVDDWKVLKELGQKRSQVIKTVLETPYQ